MERSDSGGNLLARMASHFFSAVDRVATSFGGPADNRDHHDEIVRYEGTLRMPTGSDPDPELRLEREGRGAVSY
jgi:hypothetical protein